jgi:hypothetical protein
VAIFIVMAFFLGYTMALGKLTRDYQKNKLKK